MPLYILFDILLYLIGLVQVLVIVMVVMSLLISFNVINTYNEFVAAVWRAVNVLLEPMLRPIRKIMPDTGAIDFSPMVLVVLLEILRRVVIGMMMSYAI